MGLAPPGRPGSIRAGCMRGWFLERRLGTVSDETVDTGVESSERPRSRRALLSAAGVAAGAVAAGRLLAPESADAADGGNLVLGQANTATSKTSLATSG